MAKVIVVTRDRLLESRSRLEKLQSEDPEWKTELETRKAKLSEARTRRLSERRTENEGGQK